MNNTTFEPFPKIARLSREMAITEKIDGTNAQIYIWDRLSDIGNVNPVPAGVPWLYECVNWRMAAGSRNRWITPENDNYGFAKWVQANADELLHLGPGRHFGEWWGLGIQRGYGLKEKRFSLFAVDRWGYPGFREGKQEACPNCCHIVPVLYRGIFDTDVIKGVLFKLKLNGSVAAPGFQHPEGIVIYHTASKTLFKKTVEHDEAPKSRPDHVIPIIFKRETSQ